VERRLVAGIGLTWEPPPAELLEPAGGSWAVRVEPFAYPGLGRLTRAAVDRHLERLPGARLIDAGELQIGGRDATRILLHAALPEGPVSQEEWRVDAGGHIVLLRARCPVAAYDGLADAFAAAAGSLRLLT
jgi:hypothetical protein